MLKPPAQYGVVQDFLRMYKNASDTVMHSKSDVERLVNLRCSQLPFCPTSLLLDYKLQGLHRSMGMMMSYYVTVGSAVHEVMQNYLSRQGSFLADYYCTQCGTLYPMSHQHECCDYPTEYHEVTISFLGVVGHIDAIFKDRNGDYWILDFKTTSLSGSVKKKSSPGVVYEEQVESYAYLLYRQYGIKVRGVMLVFLPRDNPMNPVVWARELVHLHFKKIHDRIKGYRKTHKAAMEATTAEEVLALAKANKCGNAYCKYCKLGIVALKAYVKRAFNTKHALPMKDLRLLVAKKPEGMITVARLLPAPYTAVKIPVAKMKELGPEDHAELTKSIKKALRKLNLLTHKLEK